MHWGTDLTGRVALVTGASRGIGAEVARRLASKGAAVACVARTVEPLPDAPLPGSLAETVADVEAAGGTAVPVVADLSREEDCAAAVAATTSALGPVDILINNAAVAFFGPALELSPKRWRLSWEVTVGAAFHLSRLVRADMVAKGAGRIVNISSVSAVGPGRGPYDPDAHFDWDTVYGAQKAALERLTQGLARELYPAGVGVCAVAPSQVVPTPGALFNDIIALDDPDAEPPAHMAEAIRLLVTLPLDDVTGRVTYSQELLREQGSLQGGGGLGVDPDLPVSGFALR